MTTKPPTPKLTDLSQQRLELAARLLRQKSGNPSKAPSAPSIPRLPRTPEPPTFPLSFTQQRLWILDQLDPGLAAYYIPVAVRFTGRLDLGMLTQSLNEIGRRHEVLRTTFEVEAERPVQVIHPAAFQPLPLIDLTHLEETARETELAGLVKADLHRPFDLAYGPLLRLSLFRLGEAEHLLLLTIHHIVCDGWSLGVIVREITALYAAFSTSRESPLPELPIQYADYAAWQREWFQGDVLETQLAYWKKQLAGATTVLELPSDHLRPAVQSFRGAGQLLTVPSAVTESLKALSQREGVTLFMTMLAAFQTLLHRYSGQDDIIVGTPIANRTRVETEGLIGYFANMLALRTDLSGDPSFLDLLRRVRESALGAYAHQDLPFEQLVEALELERDLSRNPLFQVLFGLHNAPVPPLELPGLTVSRPTLKAETSRFDLGLDMWESAHELVGALEYNTDLFDDATLLRFIEHFQTLLKSIVANPEQRLSRLALLTEAEQQRRVEWNATQAVYPDQHCVHQLFASQVEQTPEVIAVTFSDAASLPHHLTYQELNRRADQLAHYLRGRGVGPEVRVGVCLERSVEMVVGLLGVLKAGGAYVPLDPAYPAERLAFMLEDSQAAVVLTQSWGLGARENDERLLRETKDRFAGQITSHESRVTAICLDTDWPLISQSPISNPQSSISPESLAYILYTSGSTGRPKGVQISHRALVNFLCSVQRQPGLSSADVLLSVTTVAFDIFGLELYLPLITGARVELASRETAMDGAQLREQLLTSGATVMQATPATWRLLLDTSEESEVSRLDLSGFKILCGGEALSRTLADRLLATGGELWNLYGPTETTIWSSVQRIEAGEGPIVIGRPLANTQFYILDQHSHPVPVGVIGELHIGGDGLAWGYLRRPELTAEKFIPNPFAAMEEARRRTEDGGRRANQSPSSVHGLPSFSDHRPPSTVLRLYKTGDLARYLPNGTIECLGRLDHQVKVRGYRIELGEIEAVLKRHSAVREAVALVREDVPGDQRLVAYLVLKPGPAPTIAELRQFLKESLPEYMVPSAFIVLEQLPLTPNGKLDRKALVLSNVKGLPASARLTTENYVAPRDATETTLAKIWADLLGLERVSIHDNFFALGGDSLLAVRVIARAGQAGLRFSNKLFFQHPTIAELARALVGAPEINAEQGLVVGPVPLTPILHWYFDLGLSNPHFNNLALLLETPPGLDPAPLTPAVQAILTHHDALRSRFERGARGWEMRLLAPEADTATVDRIDLSALPPSERRLALEVTAAQLQTSLHLSQGPLLRLAYFDLGPTLPGRLLLVCHHLVMDAFSLQVVLADLMTAYEQIRQRQTVQLPPKTTSLKYWAERLANYARSETLRSELDYWLSLPWNQIAPLPVDFPAERENNLQGRIETTAVLLSVEETTALLQQVRSTADLHVADFLLTALRSAFAPWTGDRPLLVDLVGYGREPLFDDVDLSRTAHWGISLIPLFLKAAGDPLPALHATQAARRRLPQGGIGFGVLRYLGEGLGRGLPGAEIQFSYLGPARPESDVSHLRLASESPGMTINPSNKRPELFYCHSHIQQGQLFFRFAYGENLYRRDTVEKLAGDFLEALRTLIRVANAEGRRQNSARPEPSLSAATPLTPRRSTPVPLVLGALWFFRLNAPPPYQWNLATLLEIDYSLVPNLMRQAVQAVVRQHDALNLRFAHEADGWRAFIVEPDETPPFTYFDFSGLAVSEHRAAIEAAAAELQTRINILEGPLLQVAYMNLGRERPGRFLVILHHLAGDIFSLRIVCDDLQTAYRQLSQGQLVNGTKRTTFKHWSERLSAYAQSAEALHQLDYWLSRPWQRLAPLPLDYHHPEPTELNTLGSVRKAQAALSTEETGRLLRQVTQAYGAPLLEILLAAMVQTVVQWTKTPALLIEVMDHGRVTSLAEINLSRTVGWLAIGYPALFELEESTTLRKAVLAIREQLRTLPTEPVIGIGYQLLRDMRGNPALTERLWALPQPEVVFNYLGQLSQGTDRQAPIRPAAESPDLGGHPQRLRQRLLEFVMGIVGGRLVLTISYSENLHRRETIERLAENFVALVHRMLAEG